MSAFEAIHELEAKGAMISLAGALVEDSPFVVLNLIIMKQINELSLIIGVSLLWSGIMIGFKISGVFQAAKEL
jgi:hypothetical protein